MDLTLESMIYSFLELHKVPAAELKIQSWYDSFSKFEIKQVYKAMKNYNETREPWEECEISRVILRIEKKPKIENMDLITRISYSNYIFTQMIMDCLELIGFNMSHFFYTDNLSKKEKCAIIDDIEKKFIDKYHHTPEQPWKLKL